MSRQEDRLRRAIGVAKNIDALGVLEFYSVSYDRIDYVVIYSSSSMPKIMKTEGWSSGCFTSCAESLDIAVKTWARGSHETKVVWKPGDFCPTWRVEL